MTPRRQISWDEFDALMHGLALAVSERGPIDAVVGVARGGSIVGCHLSFLLGVDYFPVRLKKHRGATTVVVAPTPAVAGMRLALCDDLSQSGETFKIAERELSLVGAGPVTTVALVRRVPGFCPDVWALEAPSKVRFPWARDQLVDGAFVKR